MKFLSAILDRWATSSQLDFIGACSLRCVWQKLFFDTESFGSFFGMLRVLAGNVFFGHGLVRLCIAGG